MPNWATNNVEVYGDKETLEKILADAKQGTFPRYDYSSWNKETGQYDKWTDHPVVFSFQALVPMPDGLASGKTYKAGQDHSDKDNEFAHAMRGDLDYPYTNAYDWHLAHWGTKWDIDQDSLTLNAIQPHKNEFRFTLGFSTAWSPACQFWHTLSGKYGVRVVNHYYEEGINFIGTYEVSNGEILNDTCVDISPAMYRKAGAELDSKGDVDWENSDVDLSVLFPIV
jgi:hypothetical protein